MWLNRELRRTDGLEARDQLRIHVYQRGRSLRRQDQLQEGPVPRYGAGPGVRALSQRARPVLLRRSEAGRRHLLPVFHGLQQTLRPPRRPERVRH